MSKPSPFALTGNQRPLPRGARLRLPVTELPIVTLGAAGMFIGQPNPLLHVPAAVLLVPFCLYLLATRASSGKTAFLNGWGLGLLGNILALYWLIFPLSEVGGLPYPLAAPCVVLLSAVLACYSGLACVGMHRSRLLLALPGKEDSPTLLGLLLAPVLGGLAFGGFEILCGTLFTGFPWISLSSAFALWPAWVQAASLIGSYSLTAVYAIAACLAASAFASCGKTRVAAAVLALAIAAAAPIYGMLRLQERLPETAAPSLSLIMVQGNINQNQKWDPAFQQATLNHFIGLSEKAMEALRKKDPDQRLDLILWPETAMPFYFQAQDEHAFTLRQFAASNNVNLAFGTLGAARSLSGAPHLYNRLHFLGPDGNTAGYYDKQHLVPFGEYIPFAIELEFLRNILQGLDFSPGTVTAPLRLPLPAPKNDPLADAVMPPLLNGQPQVLTPGTAKMPQTLHLGVLICYEAIFPGIAQTRVEDGAQIFINISNDAWFGKTSAPLQHLSLTAMRAVEQARPVVRATNTGYTAVIDARGRIVQRGGLFEDDTFFATIAPSSEITLYHRLHPVPEWLLALAALFSMIGYKLRNHSE